MASMQVIDSGQGILVGEEYRFQRKDGSLCDGAEDRGFILRNAEGKAIRMVGGMRDLTEQEITGGGSVARPAHGKHRDALRRHRP